MPPVHFALVIVEMGSHKLFSQAVLELGLKLISIVLVTYIHETNVKSENQI
jgi:hypothetical protein